MNIAAFDLSLTATGYALASDGIVTTGTIATVTRRGLDRLRWIRDQVLDAAAGADLVALEGYAFARANQAHQLGELGGVVRLALYERRVVVVDVPPASLKLFATGKGNAKKEDMLGAAIRRLGYARNDHNEADALWLLRMAQCGAGLEIPTNAEQRRALEKIAWPALPTRTSA